MILFQVRDLAAKVCGEPHVAPSWEIAKASLGAILVKNPELADRAKSVVIEKVCEWDPEFGLTAGNVDPSSVETGDVCLAEYRSRAIAEEVQMQEAADNAE